jgi:hypothetical protein
MWLANKVPNARVLRLPPPSYDWGSREERRTLRPITVSAQWQHAAVAYGVRVPSPIPLGTPQRDTGW